MLAGFPTVGSVGAGDELPNNFADVDPPGQLNTRGKSFAAALLNSGIYTFGEEDLGGKPGLDTTTLPFPTFVGSLPGPGTDDAVTIWTDNTKPDAKLTSNPDGWIWDYFVDDENFGIPTDIYVQSFGLDHPTFENCTNFPRGP